jgi:hypothetical protein
MPERKFKKSTDPQIHKSTQGKNTTLNIADPVDLGEVQRTLRDSNQRTLTPKAVMQLQRLVGNQSTSLMIHRKLELIDENKVRLTEEEGSEYTILNVCNQSRWYRLEAKNQERYIYDVKNNSKYAEDEGADKFIRFLAIQRTLFSRELSSSEQNFVKQLTQDHPKLLRSLSSFIQVINPTLFPHSEKKFKTGTLQLTQENILSGEYSGYIFETTESSLNVYFGETKLGYMTYTKPGKGQLLKVGELDAVKEYRGINISRVLMVMLCQTVKKFKGKSYSVGQDTEITNKDYWNQYNSNVDSLLARGDFQLIDVPQHPVNEVKTKE